MQVTQTHADGLKREFRVVIGAADLDQRLDTRLETLKGQIRLKGFRPGKAPVSFLKKTYGKSLMGEIVQEAVTGATEQAIKDHELRPALQPSIEFENKLESVVDDGADLTFKLAFELLPEIQLMDMKSISVTRPVAELEESDIDEALKRLVTQQRSYETKPDGSVAAEGDALTIDFLGKVDGVPFEGGKGEDVRLVIGSKSFIPGFEEQLLGVAAGDQRTITVTFPEAYPVESLKGKAAEFDVTVHEIRAPKDPELNDEFATKLGLESLDKLKEILREQIGRDYKTASRQHVKRHLLDRLDEGHSFDLPGGMVEAEFQAIWKDVQHSLEHGHPEPSDVGKSEEELKADYRKIAERRVRLGLVLAEVARTGNVQVSQDEVSRALAEQARRYPGQEQQVYQFYQKNPQALAELRAPLIEEKVVDYILELASVAETPVSKAELFDMPAADQASRVQAHHDHEHGHSHDHEHEHVHGPDCDHDH